MSISNEIIFPGKPQRYRITQLEPRRRLPAIAFSGFIYARFSSRSLCDVIFVNLKPYCNQHADVSVGNF